MADKSVDLCRFTTATTGTGPFTVGAAVPGFLTPAQAGVVNGDVGTYAIFDGTNSETGRGTYSSTGPTVTRTSTFISTAGVGTAINLSGSAQVVFTPLAENITLSGGLTVNTIPKASGAAGLINSSITDDGTTVGITGSLTISGQATTTGGELRSLGTNAGIMFEARDLGQQWQWYAISNLARLYNGAGDTISIDISGNVSTPGAISAANQIGSSGAAAGYLFQARDLAQNWLLYATGGVARLWNGATGDVFKVSTAGHVTLEGVTSTGSTGTGKFVFDTAPTFVTPSLGVASATSINNIQLPAVATGAQLVLSNNTVITFPTSSDTMAGLATLQAFTKQNIYNVSTTLVSATAAALDDLKVSAATATITGNTGSPITRLAKVGLYRPTITDASAVTVTDAATLYIDNAPLAAGSVTLTNTWALLVGAGNAKFAGHVNLEGVLSTGATGTGKLVFDGTPTLVTPNIGAATGASLVVTSYLTAGASPNGYATLSLGDTTHAGYLGIFKGDGTRLGYLGYSNTNFALTLENSASFTVSGGYVGIGSTTPINALQVEGGTGITIGSGLGYMGNIYYNSGWKFDNATGLGGAFIFGVTDPAIRVYTASGNTGAGSTATLTNVMNILASGLTGIGPSLATPTKMLHVYSTTSTDGIFVDGNTDIALGLMQSGAVKAYIGVASVAGRWVSESAQNDIVFRVEGGALRINTNSGSGGSVFTILGANGFIGINKTVPVVALDVVGQIAASISFRNPQVTYASRPGSPTIGDTCNISDSNTATWRATIAGGGANKVLARYDGTNWTVVG